VFDGEVCRVGYGVEPRPSADSLARGVIPALDRRERRRRRKSDTIAPHARGDFVTGGIAIHFKGSKMSKIVRSVLALTLALAVVACAAPPPPAPLQPPPPPPKHQLDAKTQLETGRTY
jgi:hypothetical protein